MAKLRLTNNIEAHLQLGHVEEPIGMDWVTKQRFTLTVDDGVVILFIDVDSGDTLYGNDWGIDLGKITKNFTFKPSSEKKLMCEIEEVLEEVCHTFETGIDKKLLKIYKRFQDVANKTLTQIQEKKATEREAAKKLRAINKSRREEQKLMKTGGTIPPVKKKKR